MKNNGTHGQLEKRRKVIMHQAKYIWRDTLKGKPD